MTQQVVRSSSDAAGGDKVHAVTVGQGGQSVVHVTKKLVGSKRRKIVSAALVTPNPSKAVSGDEDPTAEGNHLADRLQLVSKDEHLPSGEHPLNIKDGKRTGGTV